MVMEDLRSNRLVALWAICLFSLAFAVSVKDVNDFFKKIFVKILIHFLNFSGRRIKGL